MYPLVAACFAVLCAGSQDVIGASPASAKAPSFLTTTFEHIELVDKKRIDPYYGGPRKLMLTLFYPCSGDVPIACSYGIKKYLPETTGEHLEPMLESLGILDMKERWQFEIIGACVQPPEHDLRANYPIVLFSHGLNSSRLLSSLQARSLAMRGYAVLTIDHPGTARVVTWKNGSVSLSTDFSTNALVDQAVQVRSEDISFVLDQLDDVDSDLSAYFPHRIPGEKVGGRNDSAIALFGHSLGGATGLRNAVDDGRLAGIANLDGYPFGFNTTGTTLPFEPVFNLPSSVSKAPVLVFNAPRQINATAFTELWRRLPTGKRIQLRLRDAGHWTFTDLPSILARRDGVNKLPGKLGPGAEDNLGTIEGERAMNAIVDRLAAFFDVVLRNGKWSDLRIPSATHPEVSVARPSSEE